MAWVYTGYNILGLTQPTITESGTQIHMQDQLAYLLKIGQDLIQDVGLLASLLN